MDAGRALADELKKREREWTIPERAKRQLELGEQIKPLEKERKEHSEHLQAYMIANDLGNKAEIGGVVCTIVPITGSEWLDKQVLIEKGVGIDVIDAATKHANDYTQFRTGAVKEK